MKLNFYCGACRKYVDKEHPSYPVFEFSGYSDDVVSWSDEMDAIPSEATSEKWKRSNVIPTEGSTRVIRIQGPFSEQSDATFWSLYTPALAHYNGWDCHPEEIEESAFVKVKIVKVFEKREKFAWIKVNIERVILFRSAIQEVMPVDDEALFIRKIYDIEGTLDIFGDWIHFHASAQGDLGYTILIKVDESGICHLVYYMEWGNHCDAAYFGNIILSKESVDELASRDPG
ncbi:hypothetical protein, partial [Oleiphilus sp. HI0123]